MMDCFRAEKKEKQKKCIFFVTQEWKRDIIKALIGRASLHMKKRRRRDEICKETAP